MKDIEKVDRVFPRYIRELNAVDGYCTCFTCGAKVMIMLTDCGHFRSRRNMATRWNEYNCAPQCINCNRARSGVYDVFRAKQVDKYGLQTVENLVRLSHQTVKYTSAELDTIYQNYREKLDTLMVLKANKFY